MLFDYLFFRLNFKILVVGGRSAPRAPVRFHGVKSLTKRINFFDSKVLQILAVDGVIYGHLILFC